MSEAKEAIRIFRKEACMTQKELAHEIGFSCLSVKRWESGKTVPDTTAIDLLLALADDKDVSAQCRKHLAEALRAVKQDALNVPNSNLYSVDRDSICSLVDDSHNAVFVCCLETDELLYVNHKAEEYAGKAFRKGQRQTCYQYFHDRPEPCLKCPKWQLSAKDSSDYHEVAPRTGRHYHVRGRKLIWNGMAAHAQYFFDETTALERQGGFEKLVDGLDAGICTCWVYDDGRFQINYMNDGYFAICNSSRQKRAQFAGYGVMNAVFEADQERFKAAALEAGRAQRSFRLTYRVVSDDSSLKELDLRAKFQCREDGKSLYYCVITDAD